MWELQCNQSSLPCRFCRVGCSVLLPIQKSIEENATILTNNEFLFQDKWSSAYDVQRQPCSPSKVYWVASIIILLPVLCMSRSIDNWSSRFQFENKSIQFNTLHCKTEENSPFKKCFFKLNYPNNMLLMFEPACTLNTHSLELEYFNYDNVKCFKTKFLFK
jgi:hypothetical protein